MFYSYSEFKCVLEKKKNKLSKCTEYSPPPRKESKDINV